MGNDGKTKSRLRDGSEGASRLLETLTPDFHWLMREDGSPHLLLLADVDPDVHEEAPAHAMPRRGVTSGAARCIKADGSRERHSCTSDTVPTTKGKDRECKKGIRSWQREGGSQIFNTSLKIQLRRAVEACGSVVLLGHGQGRPTE